MRPQRPYPQITKSQLACPLYWQSIRTDYFQRWIQKLLIVRINTPLIVLWIRRQDDGVPAELMKVLGEKTCAQRWRIAARREIRSDDEHSSDWGTLWRSHGGRWPRLG